MARRWVAVSTAFVTVLSLSQHSGAFGSRQRSAVRVLSAFATDTALALVLVHIGIVEKRTCAIPPHEPGAPGWTDGGSGRFAGRGTRLSRRSCGIRGRATGAGHYRTRARQRTAVLRRNVGVGSVVAAAGARNGHVV